ncbi:MAG: serine--tRNA ligase, partial [Alphaproteobacteria bacterium]
MLDIKWIRENPELLADALQKRGQSAEDARASVDDLVASDAARRDHITRLEEAQARRNTASKAIGQAKASGDEETAQALMAEVGDLKTFLHTAEETRRTLDDVIHDKLAVVPNIPLDDVPIGADEADNREERKVGERPGINDAKQHFELGEATGQMDFETAAKLSGSRFVVIKNQLARLQRALGQFMLDLHTNEHGYTEIQPPLLVRDEVLFGTGQLPKFAEDQFPTSGLVAEKERFEIAANAAWKRFRSLEFEDIRDFVKSPGLPVLVEELEKIPPKYPLWLIPTAEVPLTNLVREEILSADDLPLRFTALTPCFRSEAGSAGRDTRGMLRQHQFDKVELVSITAPEKSIDEHERMTACAEEVLKRLDLHYRVLTLCTGDMGFGARKTYDLEVWLPGQGAYREISSCSVCGDFQARRMNTRYRPAGEKSTQFVHTLNGSGVAVGRGLIAVMENYQNSDGSITVPDALRPYMGGLEKIDGPDDNAPN